MPDSEMKQEEVLGTCRLASYLSDSIVDGPGLRLVLFTQGCPHRCPGCHNPQTHLRVGGKMTDLNELLERYERNPLLQGVTLSGGEPFMQAGALAPFARAIRARGGDVIVYSGFTYKQLKLMAEGRSPGEKFSRMPSFKPDAAGVRALLDACDLLIDGPFVVSLRNIDLLFRGSSNQRLLALSEHGHEMLRKIGLEAETPETLPEQEGGKKEEQSEGQKAGLENSMRKP